MGVVRHAVKISAGNWGSIGKISFPAQGARTIQSLARNWGRLPPSGLGELDSTGLLPVGVEAWEFRDDATGLCYHDTNHVAQWVRITLGNAL